MAYTIEKIQTLINQQSLDARQLVNLIADYIQANPPGGGGGGGSPTLQEVASSATVTPLVDSDLVVITAQAVALTLANPSGTYAEGETKLIRIEDNGTARTISYGNQYRGIGVTLPITTVAGKLLYIAIVYNLIDNKWDVLSAPQEA